MIHLDRLETFFYETGRSISLAVPFTDLKEIEKEYHLLEKSDSVYRITVMVVQVLRFCSDTAAALECLGLIGVVILCPAVKGLAFASGTIGICANVLELSQKVYENYLMAQNPREYEAIRLLESPKEPDLSIDWSQNLCLIVADICFILSDFFEGVEFAYGIGGVTPAVYRFWKTSAALARTVESYLGSKG